MLRNGWDYFEVKFCLVFFAVVSFIKLFQISKSPCTMTRMIRVITGSILVNWSIDRLDLMGRLHKYRTSYIMKIGLRKQDIFREESIFNVLIKYPAFI